MWLKRQHAKGNAARAGSRRGGLDDSDMAFVDAVKVSNGDSAAATGSRNFIQAVEDFDHGNAIAAFRRCGRAA